jgi:hypothetical protein
VSKFVCGFVRSLKLEIIVVDYLANLGHIVPSKVGLPASYLMLLLFLRHETAFCGTADRSDIFKKFDCTCGENE